MEASFEVLLKRDTKGLYGPDSLELDVVGKDIKWNPPKDPDIVINTDSEPDVSKIAIEIIENMKR